jgi:hypothetical protein
MVLRKRVPCEIVEYRAKQAEQEIKTMVQASHSTHGTRKHICEHIRALCFHHVLINVRHYYCGRYSAMMKIQSHKL